ncbi:alpha/beta hydrolase [Legionella fallonii]|uniref:Esterase/lipase n=1 Tax=Legionella fallonii LLAP-10 TaxID=1212491 RepID=A0A098GA63_9GAMM|nr:alpha/beta fold hydrolase [Legionella fallonii]CEG58905.1 Esterase/lipase [Legionella fallonii LLAP-10]
MNYNDFRYMRRGKQLSSLTRDDLPLIKPINERGSGNEKALLLLHGFSSTPAVFRYLLPQIKHYDAIVCPALKGHAESIEAFSLSTANDWRLSAHIACKSLLKEYRKVDVLGLSLGGLLACELSQHFTLNHLFLLAPALKLNMHVNMSLKLAQVLKCLGFHQLRNSAGNLVSNQHAEITYRKLPIVTIIEMLSLAQNYQWIPPTCPTDLFLGTYDEVVASAEVEKLFSSLSNATIHWLKNSAHLLPLDNDVQEIIQCINSYQ